MRLVSPTSKALWGGLAAVALVVPTGLAAQRLLVGQNVRADEIFGVRLGMTPTGLRGAVARELGPGVWDTTLAEAGLVRMDWTPQATPDPRRAVQRATFELHEGVLVAVRARVAGATFGSAAPLTISAGAVRHHESLGREGARIRLIARNCPNHQAEVASLLAGN